MYTYQQQKKTWLAIDLISCSACSKYIYIFILSRGSNRRWLSKVKFIVCVYVLVIDFVNQHTNIVCTTIRTSRWRFASSSFLLPCPFLDVDIYKYITIDKICCSLFTLISIYSHCMQKDHNSSAERWRVVCIYLYFYLFLYAHTWKREANDFDY